MMGVTAVGLEVTLVLLLEHVLLVLQVLLCRHGRLLATTSIVCQISVSWRVVSGDFRVEAARDDDVLERRVGGRGEEVL